MGHMLTITTRVRKHNERLEATSGCFSPSSSGGLTLHPGVAAFIGRPLSGVRWHGKTTPEYSEVIKWVGRSSCAPFHVFVPTEVKRSGSLQELLLPAHERQTQSERTRIDAWFSWVTPTKLLRWVTQELAAEAFRYTVRCGDQRTRHPAASFRTGWSVHPLGHYCAL